MVKPVEVKVDTVTVSKASIELTGEQLLRILKDIGYTIPDYATVTVHVPGGGDWSNTDLDIEEQTPIKIAWKY